MFQFHRRICAEAGVNIHARGGDIDMFATDSADIKALIAVNGCNGNDIRKGCWIARVCIGPGIAGGGDNDHVAFHSALDRDVEGPARLILTS